VLVEEAVGGSLRVEERAQRPRFGRRQASAAKMPSTAKL
jgi:hypothetical protein